MLEARLRSAGACREAIKWAHTQTDAQSAWDNCPRGDWLLWAIGRTIKSEPWSEDRKPLLACALDCAETVKHLWPEKQRAYIAGAVAVLRKWIKGEASTEEAKQAKNDLYAYAYAYAAYADAAYAYAYAAAAAAGATAAAAYAAADADAVYAVYAARIQNRAETATIVRKHFPCPPMETTCNK